MTNPDPAATTALPGADVEALYRAYAPALFRVCLRYVRDEADAQDLVHAAFEKVIASGASFRGDSAAFTWVYRIAVNESLQFLRSRKGRPDSRPMLEEQMDRAAAGEGDIHLRLTLRQVLDRCDADMQEIAVLHYLEGMTQEETAEAIGLPLRTVEHKLSLFRAQARKWMTKENV